MSDETVDRLARSIAGFGIPGAALMSPASVSDAVWPGLLGRIQEQRISGLAVATADTGALQLTDEQYTELIGRHREAMAWCLMVERTLLSVARDLEGESISFVLLKGATLAHTVYPDPSWRSFGDIDLLVKPRDWRRACAVFEQAGFPREVPEPRRGFDERFGKAAVFDTTHGVQIDLHLRLVLGPFGMWMDVEELFERTIPLQVGGRGLPRLQDTELLLHVCMHASLGSNPPLLVPLRDVLQVVAAGDVDWPRFAEVSHRWNLQAVVMHAFEQASRAFHFTLPEFVKDALGGETTPKEQRLLEAYTTDRRGRGGLAISTLAAIPSVRGKVRYLRALLLPSREFLRARTGTDKVAGAHLRRWSVPASWVRAGQRGP